MTVRIGINGFGRIGRNYLRAARSMGADIEVVAINDLTSAETLAHLLRYDSTHGRFGSEVAVADSSIVLDSGPIAVLAERDPKALPWDKLGVDVVVESTGLFTTRSRPPPTSRPVPPGSSSRRPAADVDATFVMGVNDGDFDPAKDFVVSNASCTTNCFVPMVKVLDDAFGVESGHDDHHPRLHQRPEPARPAPQGPPAGPGRCHQHRPGLDRSGPGHRPGAASR